MRVVEFIVLVYCLGVPDAKGGWMESLEETINETIDAFHNGETLIRRSVIESVQKGFINQWTPQNITYDYVRDNMNFYVYTRQNWLVGHEIMPEYPHSFDSSFYKPWKKTAIVIHGFGVDSSSESVQLIKQKLLEQYDMNVIGVDYGKLMDHWWYEMCAPCGMAVVVLQAPKVGRCVTNMIHRLVEMGQSPDDIHIIGHSLGAHVAGFSGKYLQLFHNKTVARVTGLDPSSPGFTKVSDWLRLAKNDAQFTDCIYTTARSISVRKPLCQANFYPNGCGKSQPGCFTGDFATYGGCSHSRAIHLFAESIEPQSVFRAQRCNGIPCVTSYTSCWSTENDTSMGYKADNKVFGLFYTETNSAYPFSRESLEVK